jgi:hypothetical protein
MYEDIEAWYGRDLERIPRQRRAEIDEQIYRKTRNIHGDGKT